MIRGAGSERCSGGAVPLAAAALLFIARDGEEFFLLWTGDCGGRVTAYE